MGNYGIWSSTVDGGTWNVAVVQSGDDPYRGDLTVSDKEGNKVHHQTVSISYGAQWGPDVDDIAEWQAIALDVIDNPEKREQ